MPKVEYRIKNADGFICEHQKLVDALDIRIAIKQAEKAIIEQEIAQMESMIFTMKLSVENLKSISTKDGKLRVRFLRKCDERSSLRLRLP